MEAALGTAGGVLSAIMSLGVPWWGWTALVVMIFWGLLVPRARDGEEPEDGAPTFPLVP